jgi:hypothetical protein
MGFPASRWQQIVTPHFGDLVSSGFPNVTADDTSNWQTWVQYASNDSPIRIVRTVEFDRVEVHLYRLVNGQNPPFSQGTVDGVGYQALFDNIMESRGNRTVERGGLSDPDVERQLAYWSDSLRQVTPDFLSGDLSSINEAASLGDERVRRHPWPPAG